MDNLENTVKTENKMQEKMVQYDKIFNTLVNNIFLYGNSHNKTILINELDLKKNSHKLFIKTITMLQELSIIDIICVKKKISLFYKIFYRKYFKNIKINKTIENIDNIDSIDINHLLNFIAEAFELNIEIFNDIYNAYYKKKRGN